MSAAPSISPGVSFVVPVYNASGHLEAWRAAMNEALERLDEAWEVVLVDDGSSDGSWEIIAGWARESARFRAFGLTRNFGQHAAMTAGFTKARGTVIMSLDDDLQIPPSVIPAFVEAARGGADVVAGYRKNRADAFLSRQVPSFLLNRFFRRITGARRRDFGCNHVAYRRWVVEAMLDCSDRRRFTPELVAWTGGRLEQIEVPHADGPSRYSLARLIRLNLVLATHYTLWPVHIAAIVGGVLLVAFAIVSFTRPDLHNELRFHYSLINTALLGSVLSLFGTTAILVERLIDEVVRRPLFLIHPDRVVDKDARG